MEPIYLILLAGAVVAFVLLNVANRYFAERQSADPARRFFLGAVLVAEPHASLRRVLTRILRERCGEVVAVADGQEAVVALESRGFDLVLSAVHLGEPLGYEVCHRSKARRHDTPVILMAGDYEPFDDTAYRECGADAFLRKPFHTDELLGLITRLLARPSGP